MTETKVKGKIYLIGAGPGDPGLLTVRGREILERAAVVVLDAGVNPALLRYTQPQAQILSLNLQEVPDLEAHLNSIAYNSKITAYLFNDDPLISHTDFVAELACLLNTVNVPFEIVPGVAGFIASAAYAGIPLVQAEQPTGFSFQAGASQTGAVPAQAGTRVYQLFGAEFEKEVAHLLAGGTPQTTPAAVIVQGSTWQQRVISGTLGGIMEEIQRSKSSDATNRENVKDAEQPMTFVLGEGVKLREKLRWFDLAQNRPLLGKRLVVTRAREQASTLVAKLTELGADALEFAAFKIVPPADLSPMDEAIAGLHTFDWVIFTSVNGPEFFMQRLHTAGKDARAFANAKICAIGPATAAALEKYNLQADLIPAKFVAESILESFEKAGGVSGTRFLLARADVARENLASGLRAMGGVVSEVTAYRQVIAVDEGLASTSASSSQMLDLLATEKIDAVLFTSSNTVRNFAKRLSTVSDLPLNQLIGKTVVACIGPITSAAARDEYNLKVTLEAPEFTIDRLVDSLVEYFNQAVGLA